MSVINNNTNIKPMVAQGATASTPSAPTSITNGQPNTVNNVPNSIAAQPVTTPIQIVGLVPVFPCCVTTTGCSFQSILIIQVVDVPLRTGGTASFNLYIGTGGPYTFSFTTTDSIATIQGIINAVLPTGVTCIVAGGLGAVYTITLNASGNFLNEYVSIQPVTNGDVLQGSTSSFTCYINSVSAIDAQAVFTLAFGPCSPYYRFQLQIQTTLFPSITINSPTTSYTVAQIEALINTSLTSAGITSTVIVVSGSLATNNAVLKIILNAPTGSGATWNGYSLELNPLSFFVCGVGYVVNNFTGGVNAQSKQLLIPSGSVCDCDCRYGLWTADMQPDDRDYTLPVFADLTCTDSYHNDINSFLFSYPGAYNPITSNDFTLTKLVNGTWTQVAVLNSSTYGTPIYQTCATTSTTASTVSNVGGYIINWNLVLSAFGEGMYQFNVTGVGYTTSSGPYCLVSPPFCLKTWTCFDADSTCKFEAKYLGGTFGSVTTQGSSWSLCCNGVAFQWADSIRFYAFFGYRTIEYQRDFVKYATGVINKVRDEAIEKYQLRTNLLPMWFHERFYAYALMADQLYVSDYNINNPDYNLKNFYVVADGNYIPVYNNWTRYMKVLDLDFKKGDQFVFRDRCCS